jgi:hypothetical protein
LDAEYAARRPPAAHPGCGRDVDDAAVARPDHRRQELLAGQERAHEVGLQYPVPLPLVEVGDALDAEHACRVDQEPGVAEIVADPLGRLVHVRRIPHGGAVTAGPGQVQGNLLRRILARVQAGDHEPVPGQAAADRGADPARGTGDDSDPGAAGGGAGRPRSARCVRHFRHTTSATVRVSRIAAQKDR